MSTPERRKEAKSLSGESLLEATRIARGEDPVARRDLATRTDLPPELLFFLAEDKNTMVRRAVAANPMTPRRADQFLATDADEGVRESVASKMAEVANELEGERRESQRTLGLEVLETLARDTTEQVRARLSEALGDVETAPPEVVSRVIEVLARDTVIEVAGPILERSPLLSDDLLVELVQSPRAEGARARISSRRMVSERVSDAIVGTDDDEAISALLSNETAQIREETLDSLIDLAPSKSSWHAPLVRRPKLAARQVDRLSEFVATALVTELSNRTDIDPESSKRLHELVTQKIEEAGAPRRKMTAADRERARAVELHGANKLDAAMIEDSLRKGKRAFVLAALSVLSELEETVVHAMISSGNARAVTALAWKSSLPMSVAEQLQRQLAYVPSDKIIEAGIRGEYPIEDDVLTLQLELYTEQRAAG
jgi:uncharacterized protein (DUF2336 family)